MLSWRCWGLLMLDLIVWSSEWISVSESRHAELCNRKSLFATRPEVLGGDCCVGVWRCVPSLVSATCETDSSRPEAPINAYSEVIDLSISDVPKL